MPIHAHFWGVLGVKIGEIGNRFSGLVSGREQKLWSQKNNK